MRKLSSQEKEKRGTLRANQTYKPLRTEYEGYPQPTSALTAAQKPIFKRICDYLKTYGILMDADAAMVTALAVAIDLQGQAAAAIAENGLIQTYKNGARNVSPELSAFEKCAGLVAKLCRELGIGVRSRDTLSAFLEQEDEQDDPLAELMAMGI